MAKLTCMVISESDQQPWHSQCSLGNSAMRQTKCYKRCLKAYAHTCMPL